VGELPFRRNLSDVACRGLTPAPTARQCRIRQT